MSVRLGIISRFGFFAGDHIHDASLNLWRDDHHVAGIIHDQLALSDPAPGICIHARNFRLSATQLLRADSALFLINNVI